MLPAVLRDGRFLSPEGLSKGGPFVIPPLSLFSPMAKLQKWLRKGYKTGALVKFEGVPMTVVQLEESFFGEIKVVVDDFNYVFTDIMSSAEDARLMRIPIRRVKLA